MNFDDLKRQDRERQYGVKKGNRTLSIPTILFFGTIHLLGLYGILRFISFPDPEPFEIIDTTTPYVGNYINVMFEPVVITSPTERGIKGMWALMPMTDEEIGAEIERLKDEIMELKEIRYALDRALSERQSSKAGKE